MRKILLIAKRDYIQIVTSKGFLIALIFLPLMFGGSILAVSLSNRGASSGEQRIAVIDRSGAAAAAVIEAAEESIKKGTINPTTGARILPSFTFEELKPDADEAGQLLSVSDRIRSRELFLVLDIPATALRPSGDAGRDQVVYYTNSATPAGLGWLQSAVNVGLVRARLRQEGMDDTRISGILTSVPVVSMNLPVRANAGGLVRGGPRNEAQTVLVPTFLVVLLVMVVMVGAAPHLGRVAEDKTLRVFEMLLSSASPFELMTGKVLAALGACLTTTVLYIGGGLFLLLELASFGLAPLHLLPWFFVYLVADVLMLSATAVALGSACSSAQDAQQLGFILVIPIVIPMLTLGRLTQQPNGVFATVMSFIPPFTPVLMLLRQALPGGVPWWQPWVGLAGVSVCVAAIIWAAARIFRIGILAQGKTPKLAELGEWILRG